MASPNDELDVLDGNKRGEISYPDDHVPAMRVPKGGSSCSSCEYLKDRAKGICGNQFFIKWNGSGKIPAPIDQYCSDWFEPAEKST